ncbi:hypothetical protein ACFOWE_12050 [Planomonospora corallina]|uniref:Uncharacterized protein n=1 Tax=Planomonospora corallina TaxID=1806052 RepID=A0ABV8I7X5_9ACTN
MGPVADRLSGEAGEAGERAALAFHARRGPESALGPDGTGIDLYAALPAT